MASEIDIDQLTQGKKAVEGVTSALKDQTRIANQLNAAYREGTDAMAGMNREGSKGTFGKRFSKEMMKSGSVTKALSKALQGGAKDLEKAGKKAAFMAGAMRGAQKAVEALSSAMGKIKATSMSLLKSFIKLNIELMLAPLKITDALMKMANEAAKAAIPVAQASEDLANDFGSNADLLRDFAKDARAVEGELGNMFGYMSGAEFKEMGKAAAALGDTFFALAANAQLNGRSMTRLSKALGFGAEEFKAVGVELLATGKSLKEIESDFVQFGFAIQEATGVSQKIIAKDMAGIIGDVRNFGNMSTKTAAVVAGRMRSLGTTFKTLGKITDKFMNFDQAAESAAKLGQAFGMALNPMQMMKNAARDPLANLEALRKQMFATGKSSENMNAAQLRLLASQTGLSEEEAKLMFSQKNRGKSAKDLKNSMKNQMSDAERMEKAVSNLTKEFGKLIEVLTEGGIFANLQKGMTMFFQSTGKGQRALRKFQKANQDMLKVGMKLGSVLADFINAGHLDKIVDVISLLPTLMDKLMKNGFFDALFAGDFGKAFQKAGDAIDDVFGTNGGLANALDGVGAYFVNFAAQMVEWAAMALESFSTELGSNKSQSKMAKAFGRLGKAWKRFFKALWPHIKALLGFLLDEIVAWMKANPGKAFLIGMILMGNMFGPSVMMYAASALIGGLFGAIKGMGGMLLDIGKFIGKGIGKGFRGVKNLFSRGTVKKVGGQFKKGGGRYAAGATKTVGRGKLAKVTDGFVRMGDAAKSAGSKIAKSFTSKFPKLGRALGQVSSKMGGFMSRLGGLGKSMMNGASKAGGFLKSIGGKARGVLSKFGSGLSKVGGAIAKVSPTLGRIGGVASKSFGLASRAFGTAGMAIGGSANAIFEGAKMSMRAFKEGGSAVDVVGSWFAGVGKGAAEAVDFMTFGMLDKMTGFKDAFANFDPTFIGETFSYMGGCVVEGIKNMGNKIKDGAIAMKDKGKQIIKGIGQGISDATPDFVKSGAKKLISGVSGAAKKLGGWLGLSSPSRWFAENIGGPIMQGVGVGIEEEEGKSSLADKFDRIFNGAKKAIGKAGKLLHKTGSKIFGPKVMEGLGKAFKFQARPVKALLGAGSKVAKGLIGGFRKIFKLRSPSKVTSDMGEDLVVGMKEGIEKAMEALEMITPEIAEKLGISADGEMTPEAKGAMKALENTNSILEAVTSIVDNLKSIKDEFERFDGEELKAKANLVFDQLELAFLGPTGFVARQAEFQRKIKEAQVAAIKSSQTYQDTEASRASAMRLAKKRALNQNKKLIEANQSGYVDYRTLMPEGLSSDTAAFDKAQAEYDANSSAMSDMMGGLGGLMTGMTDMVEQFDKMNKVAESFDPTTALIQITNMAAKAFMLYDTIHTEFNFTRMDWDLQERHLRQYLINPLDDLHTMIEDELFAAWMPSVWDMRIADAIALQGQVAELASELQTIETLVNGIPTIELKATIDDIEDNLSIVKEFTKIKDKPISLNFKLDIHMEADKMAKAILETETARTRLPMMKSKSFF